MITSGIYQILNIVNEKFYIGSATDFTLRWSQHKWEFNNRKHSNTHLQRAWNKYGQVSFEFIVIECCSKELLLIREQYWIDTLEAVNLGYNMREVAHSNLGVKWTQEHKDKISASKLGVPQDPAVAEQRNAMNRKWSKWPCLMGSRCKCRTCKDKINEINTKNKWKRYEEN